MSLNFTAHLLQDVTPENFLAALSGRDDLVKGAGTGKVIKRSVYHFISVMFKKYVKTRGPSSGQHSARCCCLDYPSPRPQCAVNLDWNLKPKLAIMRQCTSVTDRRTLTSQHKREMYILHLALKNCSVYWLIGSQKVRYR